jgi:hypothetical protein
LDVPSEADRNKHINFLAEERSESDPAEELNGFLDKEDKNQPTEMKRTEIEKSVMGNRVGISIRVFLGIS